METKVGFTLKHREDIIDTLHLRVREKRVLFGLLVILLCTLVYENSALLTQYFYNSDFSVPALGKRKPAMVKPEMLKELSLKLAPVEKQFPQFVKLFARFNQELETAAELAKKEESRQQATYNCFMIARELYRFANNPVLTSSKELQELQKALQLLQKKMKFELDSELEIKPVFFMRGEEEKQANIHRSLFDYENF